MEYYSQRRRGVVAERDVKAEMDAILSYVWGRNSNQGETSSRVIVDKGTVKMSPEHKEQLRLEGQAMIRRVFD